MEELTKQILQKTDALADADMRIKYERFIRTFFNCKTSSNHLLLLGVDDKTLIQELLGCSAEAVIKEEADYFIRITKGRDDCMVISFRSFSKDLTFEEEEQIKTLFAFYGNENSVNLNVAFANHRIPDLIIKKGFPMCLESPHPIIRVLSGKQLIENITITTSIRNANSLHASIQDVSIITHSNKLLVDCKVEADQENRFWTLAQAEYGDVCQYNFVVLNNVDDHLMRAFTDLFKLYQSRFAIKEESRNILKRIFFIGDSKYYVSRFVEYLPSNLYHDINELVDEYKTICLYVFFLEYLQLDQTKENNSLQDILPLYSTSLNQLKTLFANELSSALEAIKKFPDTYRLLDDVYQRFSLSANDKKFGAREDYFNQLTAFAKDILTFAEEYAPDTLQAVVALQEYIKQQEQIYLQEKSLLMLKSYVKKDKEFKTLLTEIEHKINQIWTSLKENLNIVACNLSIDTIENNFKQAQSNLIKVISSNYTPVQQQIDLLCTKRNFLEVQIKEKLGCITHLCTNECDVQSLLDNRCANKLNRLMEEIAAIFETASDVYIKEAEYYQQQLSIKTEIQRMLFNELRKLQLA